MNSVADAPFSYTFWAPIDQNECQTPKLGLLIRMANPDPLGGDRFDPGTRGRNPWAYAPVRFRDWPWCHLRYYAPGFWARSTGSHWSLRLTCLMTGAKASFPLGQSQASYRPARWMHVFRVGSVRQGVGRRNDLRSPRNSVTERRAMRDHHPLGPQSSHESECQYFRTTYHSVLRPVPTGLIQ